MFTVTFPVDTGTLVKTPEGYNGAIGSYNCVTTTNSDEDFCVMVTGIHEPWCGEYLLSQLEIVQ